MRLQEWVNHVRYEHKLAISGVREQSIGFSKRHIQGNNAYDIDLQGGYNKMNAKVDFFGVMRVLKYRYF